MQHTPIEDVEAELQVVGCAVASPQGSTFAHQRLIAEQFSRPHLARLFAVTPGLPGEPHDFTEPDSWDLPCLCDRRAAEAAVATDTDDRDVIAVVNQRASLTDSDGHWAERVRRAARLRQAATEIEDVLRGLAGGAQLDDAADTLLEVAILLRGAA